MFREPFEEPDQEDSISSAEDVVYTLLDERDVLIKERDLFKKIAHDLYMAMASIDMPRQYRETCIPAMNAYLEAFSGTQ
jgi:hypothetical protein